MSLVHVIGSDLLVLRPAWWCLCLPRAAAIRRNSCASQPSGGAVDRGGVTTRGGLGLWTTLAPSWYFMAIAARLGEAAVNQFGGIGDFFDELGTLDSPLAVLSILLAVTVFLWKSLILVVWRRTRFHEQRLLAALASAQTYDRFREVVGAEPNAYRELGLRAPSAPEHLSRLFVLPHCYVEVFLDSENRVQAYTVSLRRGVLRIQMAGMSVVLGRTTYNSFLTPFEISAIGFRGGLSIFERSGPWGIYAGRTWAWGNSPTGDKPGVFVDQLPYPLAVAWYWAKRRALRALARLHRKLSVAQQGDSAVFSARMDYVKMFPGASDGRWHQLDKSVSDTPSARIARTLIPITSVAASSTHEIQPYMLNIHEWELAAIDPPSRALRARRAVMNAAVRH